MDGGAEVDKEVSGDAARVILITAPAEKAVERKRAFRGRTEEGFPIDGLRRGVGRYGINPCAGCSITIVGRANHSHLTEFSRANPFARLSLGLRTHTLAADLDDAIGFRGRVDDLHAFGGSISERLFTIDILTGLNGLDNNGLVPMIGRGHDDGVNRLGGDDVLEGRIGFDARAYPLDGALNPTFVGIRDGHNLRARHGQEGLHQLMGSRAGTDDADLDSIVCRSRTGSGG